MRPASSSGDAASGSGLLADPPPARWLSMMQSSPRGEALGRSLEAWRGLTRQELGLRVDRPLLATGHQPTLWHPGILTKYMAVSVVAQRSDVATANVVVDQDVADISGFDVPVRRGDGSLASRRIELRRKQPPADMPLGQQPAFVPVALPAPLQAVIESAQTGAARIHQHLAAHAHAPSAAEQVAAAFDELMQPWVNPMPHIMASSLMRTTLARSLLEAMAGNPQRCAEAYNEAVASEPGARLTPLLVRDDYVELPLWRIGEGARRMRAYDNDIESGGTLLPRALLMTAIVRLAACDLFVHGTGGAVYDRAMEKWIRLWLGTDVAPMAVVTATLRLPLMSGDDLAQATLKSLSHLRHRARDLWHDPAAAADHAGRPSEAKHALLEAIDHLPRRSHQRRTAFFAMHQHLAATRSMNASVIQPAQQDVERVQRLAKDAAVAQRRDWAFPLYPDQMLTTLRDAISG